MEYAVRLLTHRGKPTGYEVYEYESKKVVSFFGIQEGEQTLSQALSLAQSHADKLNGEQDGKAVS